MDYIMSPSNCMDNIKESLHGYKISQSRCTSVVWLHNITQYH